MAHSPSHQFGQIIGETLEIAIEPLLRSFADKHGLYLDKQGIRAARKGKKVSWRDKYGNSHDLDYVMERNGTEDQIGVPVAFIEAAWRRYTKHSRNKAQEIQGAILPLLETYSQSHPFCGAVLAGVFTDGALEQLQSLGFSIIHFPYETVLTAFAAVGMDADFSEKTSDGDFRKKVRLWKSLREDARRSIAKNISDSNQKQINDFFAALSKSVERKVVRIFILPLHGTCCECQTIAEAEAFIRKYRENVKNPPFVRFEVEIHYSNNDCIRASFEQRQSALLFLHSFEPGSF